MRGLVQNQLKSQSLDTVNPEAFKQVGGVIFPDSTANMDMAKLVAIVEAFQSVHSPNYGQPIPNSGKKFSRTDTGSIVTATGNEVRRVIAVSYTNASGAPITLDLELDNTVIQAGAIVGPAETVVATIPDNLFIDVQLSGLAVTVLTGDGPSLTTTALSILVVQ